MGDLGLGQASSGERIVFVRNLVIGSGEGTGYAGYGDPMRAKSHELAV